SCITAAAPRDQLSGPHPPALDLLIPPLPGCTCPSAALQPSHLGNLPQLPALDLPTGSLTSQHPGPPSRSLV
ncbi:uncharacterized protein LAESUDRAFT_727730, partial [Laetiporus sulphureus 93-53]